MYRRDRLDLQNRVQNPQITPFLSALLVWGDDGFYMQAMKRFIPFMKSDPLVSVVRLSGIIQASSRTGGGISDQSTAPLLEKE